MPITHILCAIALPFLLLGSCNRIPEAAHLSASPKRIEIMQGLSFVAPPRPFADSAMIEVRQSGADWIAVIPYGFTRPGEPKVHFNSQRQWWGERPEGTVATIAKARQHGLRIMLKPQVYVPHSWTGAIDFSTEADWIAWENSYRSYLLPMARIADSLSVELFCIGTEFKAATQKRPDFWRQLIREIRTIYDGPLTYAANWDEYEQVSFWSDLDYIGIDAYFPLSDEPTPAIADLKKAWQAPRKAMNTVARQYNRPYLFTEFGYMSVDSCAHKTWELEKKRRQLNENEQAQANALEALFQIFYDEPAWAGGFLWKWYAHESRRATYRAKDYTPQRKLAAQTLKKWYEKAP